ncbi:MAG TPA: MarR family transcriptional regulator [Acidimicrobiales bacterium]|nr:MarR family transcriptional regulator [Acidimicrobiales bacterium]
MWLLKRAFHNAHRSVNEAVRPYGITPTQMGALRRLMDEPGLSGAELARRLLVTPQAAQLAVSSLERQGLVERTPDPGHGRIVRTSVTTEGRRVMRSCLPRAHTAETAFLSVLDDDARDALIHALQVLAQPTDDPVGDVKDL